MNRRSLLKLSRELRVRILPSTPRRIIVAALLLLTYSLLTPFLVSRIGNSNWDLALLVSLAALVIGLIALSARNREP
jgi:hypothetical protein